MLILWNTDNLQKFVASVILLIMVHCHFSVSHTHKNPWIRCVPMSDTTIYDYIKLYYFLKLLLASMCQCCVWCPSLFVLHRYLLRETSIYLSVNHLLLRIFMQANFQDVICTGEIVLVKTCLFFIFYLNSL
jgi:hypothetical protein